MRKMTMLCGALALAMFAAASADAKSTLRLGAVLAPTDPLMIAAQQFKRDVEARTNKEVEVLLFPNSQLGDTQNMMDQAQAGANVGTFVEGSRMAPFVPQFNALVAPYAFGSVAELAKFVETPTFEKWNTELVNKTGLRLLSFNWYQGARHLLTKKPVKTPADLRGVRMRTIGEPLWLKTIGAMGATPTPMAWAEVYPSIQTGVIDAAEAQPAAIRGARLYEVVTDITLTEHIYLTSGLIVGEKWLQSLPAAHRQIVMEEAKKAGASVLKANVDQEGEIFDDIRKRGVRVTKVDTTPFRDAVKPLYAELGLTAAIDEARKAIGQ